MDKLTFPPCSWIFDHRGPHHIIPRSRFTEAPVKNLQEFNLYPEIRWPNESGKHSCWHLLFINMTSEEVIGKILKYTNKDGTLDKRFFRVKFKVEVKSGKSENGVKKAQIKTEKVCDKNTECERKAAWGILFGAMNGYEAVAWIKKEFIRKDWQ